MKVRVMSIALNCQNLRAGGNSRAVVTSFDDHETKVGKRSQGYISLLVAPPWSPHSSNQSINQRYVYGQIFRPSQQHQLVMVERSRHAKGHVPYHHPVYSRLFAWL